MNYSAQYKDYYAALLADAVLGWVVCVPGSYVFTYLNSSVHRPQATDRQ